MSLRETINKEKARNRQVLADTFPHSGKVRMKQVAAYLSIAESTAWAYIKAGRIKRPTKLGARTSVFDAEYVRMLGETGIPEASQEAAQ